MRTARDLADARQQLAALPHTCGDVSFDAPPLRVHDAQGLWIVCRGPCPRCGEAREERFHVAAPRQPIPPSTPLPTATPAKSFVARGGSEERDLYGPGETARCVECRGVGTIRGVTGDYAIGDITCWTCHGSGLVTVQG